ncbi:hypothetical protein Q428_15215 [Fervidicella metallireducens AeB]|uniref:DUF4926 domain-containing protein n=1 Tax=Fervidicella metallireducens AeB TaxID=1403537 RepID=A0A017RTB5_9CLOT|nr:DUF4926 domain-containing protein [Fervidicella metallireducens]EYE87120.1 hypothetical protein Q428_15215 [Fervidicella metallireducens AeB]
MYEEYDVVRAIRDINDKVPKGSKGAVLIIHTSTPPQYEVEFIDEEGNTLDVLAVHERDIEKA